MTKTKRNARMALGISLVVLGMAIWSLDNSSMVGVTHWIRNYYFFVPGLIVCMAGVSYINLMVRSPYAADRGFIAAIAGKKDFRGDE